MDTNKRKCSMKEHENTYAMNYCQECKIYLCNKCDNYHSKFCPHHHVCDIKNDINEIFIDVCKEEGHSMNLKYFCKNHNILCCAACIAKIKGQGNGQHKDCDVCFIVDIKDEKQKKLKENIKILENLSKNLEKSINEITIIFEKINKNKEDLKLKIQKVFTTIRSEINNREDQLLLEVDMNYNDLYCDEKIVKNSQKLPEKIQISLEKCKKIEKEWDEKKLNSMINECINIENSISKIHLINNAINKFKINNNSIKLQFSPEEKGINDILDVIKNFGKIENESFLLDSLIINNNKDYISSIKNWINPNKKIKTVLLYRLSRDGYRTAKFHELCDNKGPTLTLFYTDDENKGGIFTPLPWDNYSRWKEDMDTFIFNLKKNKKYEKKEKQNSIFCDKFYGPYVNHFGFENTMTNLILYDGLDQSFKNGSDIILNKKNTKANEIEIFKIIM